jgi:hypothetical protein
MLILRCAVYFALKYRLGLADPLPKLVKTVNYLFVFLIALSPCACAQDLPVDKFALPDTPSQQRFWTFENKLETGILAGLVAADAVTTQRGLNEGLREANPLMRPLVTRGAGGQAASSALGFGAGIGLAYLLHHTHHYRFERIAMRVMVIGESGFVANNVARIH